MLIDNSNANDPLGFMRNLWGNMGFSLPGMVTPTFDTDELDKRIKDLKAVEGWLRMNLSMLQMTIQGLEMQTTTLSAVKAMGNMAASAAQQVVQETRESQPAQAATEQPEPQAATEEAGAANAFSQAAMWPWNLMQQMQTHLQEQAAATQAAAEPDSTAAPKKPAAKAASGTAKRPTRKA